MELVIPKGTWYLGDGWDPTDPEQAVTIEGGKDFIINGSGCSIIIRNPRLGFLSLRNCERVIIKNISVDYDPLPFTQGFVDEIDGPEKAVYVKISAGQPTPDLPWFKKARNQFSGIRLKSDPVRTKPGQNHTLHYRSITTEKDGRYRINLYSEKHLGNTEIGDPIWIIARENGRAVFTTRFSTDITFEGTIVYASPTVVFALFMSSRCAVINCATQIKPGRWISVNADVVHAHRNRIGPVVEGCSFDGCIDDVMNIYNWALPVAESTGPASVKLQGFAGPDEMYPMLKGTDLEIVDTKTGVTAYRGKILSISGKENPVVTCDPPLAIDNLRTVIPGNKESVHSAHAAYFMAYMSSGFRIRNNVIRHGHRYGVILPSSDGLVQGNRFEDISASAIIMNNRMNIYPNEIRYHARGRIIIRDNIIMDCNLSETAHEQNTEGAIHVSFHNRMFENSHAYELSDILIEGNRIEHCPGTGIFVSSARNVMIQNNTVDAFSEIGIRIRHCSDVSVSGNTGVKIDSDDTVKQIQHPAASKIKP